jgi:hypothetical protein
MDAASPDAGIVDGGEGDASDAAGSLTCNSLANTGPVVTITQGSGPPPTGSGGTIEPGIYFLTAFIVYPTGGGTISSPDWFKQTIEITATPAAGVFNQIGVYDSNLAPTHVTENRTVTMLPSGAVKFVETCPGATQTITEGYTAIGTDAPGAQLHLYTQNSSATAEVVYTKQ